MTYYLGMHQADAKSDFQLKRSLFAVPASSEKMIEKSKSFKVDQLFLDLEDAVAPDAKWHARQLISAINRDDFQAPVISIRINAIDTPWFNEDIALLKSKAGSWVDSIILPKVHTASDVELFSKHLSSIEKTLGRADGSIAIDAQIESAKGLVNCESIAACERVSSLNFGPADFMANIGAPAESVTSHEYALMRILVAARAAGIAALDGPTLEVREIAKFEASAQIAAEMGFDGKWVLHPDQIEACHRIFTPSQERFDEAACLLEAYDHFTSTAGGAKGAAIYKGAMIDEASRKMALAVVGRGRASGLNQIKRFTP
jgi:citrate lyase subunit beta / citryl-CoA lyase